jgi:Uma2 family endonuclease
VTTRALKLATVADLLALADDVRAELIDGEIVPKAEASAKHAKAAGALRRFVGGPFDDDDGYGGPGGWWILPEILVSFPPQTYRPDLAGWRRERLPNPALVTPIEIIPDWCCEVVSPSNPAHDRVRKRRDYARHGVRYYWLVDPEQRVVEALELEQGSGGVWRECGAWDDSATDACIPPFEGITLDLSRLFLPRG